jgi:FKBP-type peptidyl-prolyl cis-trans isomerase SlyD
MKNEGSAVADGMVVSIHYTLTVDDGMVVDSSRGGTPFEYLHGAGNIVPGLETRLEGRAVGESLQVAVPPGEGYGEHDPRGVARVPRDAFPEDVELEPGMQFSGEDERGNQHVVWISAVEGDVVVVDRNHPLAGRTLHFDVTIEGVRAATNEERSHGHVHGAHGHHH